MIYWPWIESAWWTVWQWIRHPRENYYWRKKHRNPPKAGDYVEDCRYQILKVVEVDGDDLLLEDGTTASWMHCCNRPEDR